MPDRLLILDADGVLFDERPYWNAALAAALLESGRSLAGAAAWEALATAAFDVVGLQRAAKRRGCNSNHDLAAVLVRALADPTAAAAYDREVTAGRMVAAAGVLDRMAARLGDPGGAAVGDPLASFGIDRDGPAFVTVAGRFQRVMAGTTGDLDWPFERSRLCDEPAAIVSALEALSARGWELRICTGRPRAEIDGPLADVGLAGLLPPDRVTSADEVARAESVTGRPGLGKPHPFPLLCALAGFDAARRALDTGVAPAHRPAVYVGDATADAVSCRRAVALGAAVRYLHVRSPALDDDAIRAIAAAVGTVGVAANLRDVPALLAAEVAR